MGIFSSSRTNSVTTAPVFEGFVDGSFSGLQQFILESYEESYRLQAGMYVSDIMMEEAVFEGASAEPLLENFVKSTWDKLVKIFKDMWSKVQAVFNAIKRQFNLIFTSGKKFVDNFKTEIRGKTTKGFEYEGHKWNIEKGNSEADKVIDTIKSFLTSKINVTPEATQKLAAADQHSVAGQYKNTSGGDMNDNTDKLKEELHSSVGLGEDTSKILESLVKTYRGGEEAETISEFSAVTKEKMMDFIENRGKAIEEVEKSEKEINSQYSSILSAIEKTRNSIDKYVDKDASEAHRSKLTAYATHRFEVGRYGLGMMISIFGLKTREIKSAASEFERVLKSFLRYKTAKESFGSADDNLNESLLENAMRYV